MKVQATTRGQYQGYMHESGDVFEIEDKKFSPKWMKKVEVKQAEKGFAKRKEVSNDQSKS